MDDLNRILGNEPIKNYFLSAMDHERVSHAYIFEGEKGSGKKLLVSTFAKILQCESDGERPCGKCTSCIQMEHRNHPDVIWVTHEKPNLISVDEIREQVVNTIDVKPYRGPYKIYIIDEAEKMNDKAQNAILKTIEEPTEYAILFLLTTSRGAFLQTILSRCIMMEAKPVRTELIQKYLMEEEGIDEGLAEFYAGFAMGNLGKAIGIASSEEMSELRNLTMDVLKGIPEMEPHEIDAHVKKAREYKNEISSYFDMMRMWYRDLLILKTTKDRERVIFRSAMMALNQQAEQVSLYGIDQILQMISETERRIQRNVAFEPALDSLFFKIKPWYDR